MTSKSKTSDLTEGIKAKSHDDHICALYLAMLEAKIILVLPNCMSQ